MFPIHGKSLLLYWCALKVQAAPNRVCFCHSTSLCFGSTQLFSRLQFTLSSLCNQGTPAPHPQIQIKSESRLRPASPGHDYIVWLTCLARKIRSPWHMFSKQHGWSFGWNRSALGVARHGDIVFIGWAAESHRTNCSPALSLKKHHWAFAALSFRKMYWTVGISLRL